MTDSLTAKWIRNEIDERAAAAGYRFDEERGLYVVTWMYDYLCLYEGEWAGQPFECVDWQYEATMRMFGWVKHSDRWGREVRRFRNASIWVAKKNKKSPTLAAWSLYLLCGDGEQGQKVFLCAKNGQQAREIAGKHAIEMCRSSPALMRVCTINKSLMQITHEPSRSFLRPLSSDNVRSQEGQEGINGSVVIDETHVVDRRFISRISRAGISRSEPLQIEASTAGNNPSGYGKERFDYCEVVNNCQDGHVDFTTFALVYAAPQDLPDGELAADPVKYARMANPAWGHTIGEEEYLSDYNKSKSSLTATADHKMYRLNIWQASSNPWLSRDSWAKCREDFTDADLVGQTCGGGLDLSKTEDMTAFCLIFPEEPEGDYSEFRARMLTWYWLPEGAIHKHAHAVPYLEWQAQGWLRVIPNTDVIPYSFIEHDIDELMERYDVRTVAYDRKYADDLLQRLADKYAASEDEFYAFEQTIMTYAGPTAQFERMILAGDLRHDGNAITTWQAGHVEVKTDANDKRRPVKPERNEIRKIDGIVAGIMALDAAGRIDDLVGDSFYETNSVEGTR